MKLALPINARRSLLGLALGAALCASLQGCVPLVVGATAVGSMAAVDRRSIGMQTDDKTIELKGEGRASKITGDKGRVAVTSYNRMVVITGEVTDEKMKAEVEAQIKTLGDLKRLENDLEIAPVSSVSARSADLLITSKVKAAIIDTKDLYISAFKIHTDRGVVYLLGRVTQREAKLGGEVARNAAANIRKVVTLFEYISEEELLEMKAKPSPEDNRAPASTK
ncbi:MAG: BON domain-containing protein [Betaproteobacteria bacterium]|jgi:osmotically-inducible protein OsmY|nr:BON domain-containing protein [Betaproteobacteria bacterium]